MTHYWKLRLPPGGYAIQSDRYIIDITKAFSLIHSMAIDY